MDASTDVCKPKKSLVLQPRDLPYARWCAKRLPYGLSRQVHTNVSSIGHLYDQLKVALGESTAVVLTSARGNGPGETLWNFIDGESIIQRMKYRRWQDRIVSSPDTLFDEILTLRQRAIVHVYFGTIRETISVLHIIYDPAEDLFDIEYSTNVVGDATYV